MAKVATSGWSMSAAHTLYIVDLPPATGGRSASPALHSPQNVRWNVSGGMISISWEPSPVAQGRGFRIEGEAVDEWGDGRGAVALPIVLGPQARNFVQTGLVPGQPYRYRLWSEGADDDLPVEIVFSPPAVLDWQPDSLPNIAYGISKEGVFSWQHPPKEYAGQVYLVRWVSSPRRLQSEEAQEWLSRPWAPNQGQTWVPASECLQMCELTIPDWDPTLHWSVQVRSTLGNPQEWWDWTRWDPTDQWGPATPPSELPSTRVLAS